MASEMIQSIAFTGQMATLSFAVLADMPDGARAVLLLASIACFGAYVGSRLAGKRIGGDR